MVKFLDKTFKHDPNIVARHIAEELILVPIRSNIDEMDYIYNLNETGAVIWDLIDGKRSFSEIIAGFVDEFEVDVLQAELDLIELAESLIKVGAITEVQGSPHDD
jgi:hypothetical protein